MTTFDSTAVAPAIACAGDRCSAPRVTSAWLARAWAVLANWNDRVRARRQLAELDDHLLADIGLTRDDVQRLSAKRF